MDRLEPDDPALQDPARQELRRLRRQTRVVPNVHDRTWTSLLVAYLDGEERSVWVLGDYLEGEGLSRIKPGGLGQRVRYALGLVPPVLAHELACDFAEHMLTWFQHGHPTLNHALHTKRRWLAGEVTDLELKRARQAAQELSQTFGSTAVAQALSSSPSPSVAQRAAHLASSAILQLRDPSRYPTYGPPLYPNGPEAEIRWQAERLRARLG